MTGTEAIRLPTLTTVGFKAIEGADFPISSAIREALITIIKPTIKKMLLPMPIKNFCLFQAQKSRKNHRLIRHLGISNLGRGIF